MLINCLVPNGEVGNPAEIELDYAALPEVGEIIIHNDIRYEVEKRYYISHSATEDKPAGVSYMLELAEKEVEPHIPVLTNVMVESDPMYFEKVRIKCDVDGEEFQITVGKVDLFMSGITGRELESPRMSPGLENFIIQKWRAQ